MYSHIIYGLLLSLILNSFSVSPGHGIHLRSSMLPGDADVSKISNGTDPPQKLLEKNVTDTTENEVLFWAIPNANNTMEVDSGVQMDAESEPENLSGPFQHLEDSTEVETNDTSLATTNPAETITVDNTVGENSTNDVPYPAMDEKIVLQRNNCHLEIAVQENHDLRIEIKFGKLQNNTSGKCCITLSGQENSMLGVLISNTYLYQNVSEGEILKVITADYASDFVLKEYYSGTKYQPLLLTETHKVYVVLYYQVTNISPNQQDSHFNLEVFSYHKYENYIH